MSGCIAVANTLGERFHRSPDELLQIIIGQPETAKGFDELISHLNSVVNSNVTIDEILDIYRRHEPKLQLPKATTRALNSLQTDKNILLALITDGRSYSQRAKIRALGLEEYISPENIIISEEIGGDKYTDLPFKELATRLQSSHRIDTFIYVGDNPRKDFLWPNRMGWKTVELSDILGENIKPPINATGDYAAQMQINSLDELPNLITGLDRVND